MSFDQTVTEKLAKPLDPRRIRTREGGGGRSFSYLEGHDVIRTANETFGYGAWGYRLIKLTCLGTEDVTTTRNGQTKTGVRVAYSAEVEAHVGDTLFGDVGFGDAVEYTGSILTAHELASKESVTDGLKRALKNLGDQFGLALYDKTYLASQSAGEQRGAVSSPAEGSTAPTPASSSGDGLKWKYGAHAGKTLAETPLEFVMDYAANKTGFMADKCKEFLAASGGGQGGDDDIPFAPSIDGLGN